MNDHTRHPELPPQPEPKDVPEAKAQEPRTRPDAWRNPAVGAESSPAAYVTLLGSASAAMPANAEPLTGMVEHLQHQYGNTYVQRLLAEVRAPKSDDAAQHQPADPTVRHHAQEIVPLPSHGTIDAAGRFSVPYAYDLASVGDFLSVTLVVPAGVTVSALPLTSMRRSDYHLTDPGSTGARVVTLAVSTHVPTPPRMQVTLAQGSVTYVVVCHFRRASIPPPAPESVESAEGDPEG